MHARVRHVHANKQSLHTNHACYDHDQACMHKVECSINITALPWHSPIEATVKHRTFPLCMMYKHIQNPENESPSTGCGDGRLQAALHACLMQDFAWLQSLQTVARQARLCFDGKKKGGGERG